MLRIKHAFVFVVAAFFFAGCDSGGDDSRDVVALEIQANEGLPLLGVGASVQLEVLASDQTAFLPGSIFTPEDVLWQSSSSSVATVSTAGFVQSVGVGSSRVIAQVGNVIDAVTVDVVPPYVLPFSEGSFRVAQAYGGTFSHTGTFFFSYDFVMPIGTPIVAARAGVVHAVEESFVDYDNMIGHENYIVIAHADGTFARYLHLTQDGAIPEVGDTVEAGETIALSGNTGFSTLPHLHFDVTTGCALPLPACQTVEYWFANSSERQPTSGTRIAPDTQ